MAKISIVVTAYNIEAYIGDCLRDIAAQTLEDIEIIVVDDGSTDATPTIIADFAQRDPRMVPILLEQNTVGGVGTAANIGIERATGTFIGFADGDDRYDPEMFGALVDAAEAAGADLTLCAYLNWDSGADKELLPSDEARWKPLAAKGALDMTTENRRAVLALNAVPWRKVYSARLLKEQGLRFPVGDWFYEDNPFHWFNVLSASRVAFVDRRLCRHRVNRAGQTMMTVDAGLLKMFDHYATIRAWLVAQGLDATFRDDLLKWISKQLSWIGRRCPEDLREDLFRAVQTVTRDLPPERLTAAAMKDICGKRTTALFQAAAAGDFAAFDRTLAKMAETPRKERYAVAAGQGQGRWAALKSLFGRGR